MKMENYVQQLAEDLRDLLKKVPPHSFHVEPDDFDENMKEYEDHCFNQRGVWVCDHSGLTAKKLPDVMLLSRDQASVLVEGLLDLLYHYHAIPSFPADLPAEIMYKTLRSEWHKFKSPLISQCRIHHQFCDYNIENCPFPGFCDVCDEAASRSVEMHAKAGGGPQIGI